MSFKLMQNREGGEGVIEQALSALGRKISVGYNLQVFVAMCIEILELSNWFCVYLILSLVAFNVKQLGIIWAILPFTKGL